MKHKRQLGGLFHIVRELLLIGTDLEMSQILLGGEAGGKGLLEWVVLALHSMENLLLLAWIREFSLANRAVASQT